MPRGKKSKFQSKQKRQGQSIERDEDREITNDKAEDFNFKMADKRYIEGKRKPF